MATHRHSKGVAIVFVLFVVALVAVLTTTLLSSQFVQIRRLENSMSLAQLLQHAYGVEAWGLEVLKRDQLSSETDHLNENWGKPLEPVKISATNTQLAGWIRDQSALYDLNNLVNKGRAFLPDITQFKKLARQLEIEPDTVDVIVDWIDYDTLTQATGAEDPYYLGLQPAYYAASRPLSHLNEIIYIKGIDTIALGRLQSQVTTLPELSPVNVNTASAEVLELLIPGLETTGVENLIQLREETPFESVSGFLAQLKSTTGMSEAAQIDQQALAVNSRFFLVTSEVTFNDNVLQMQSRIYRDPNGGLRVYERDLQLLQ